MSKFDLNKTVKDPYIGAVGQFESEFVEQFASKARKYKNRYDELIASEKDIPANKKGDKYSLKAARAQFFKSIDPEVGVNAPYVTAKVGMQLSPAEAIGGTNAIRFATYQQKRQEKLNNIYENLKDKDIQELRFDIAQPLAKRLADIIKPLLVRLDKDDVAKLTKAIINKAFRYLGSEKAQIYIEMDLQDKVLKGIFEEVKPTDPYKKHSAEDKIHLYPKGSHKILGWSVAELLEAFKSGYDEKGELQVQPSYNLKYR